ncbi:MAG: hypothetical protein JXQ72_15805 [Anaerolineae bacterium]|nr:hypothetical protein [Anaerolineae bacterium]
MRSRPVPTLEIVCQSEPGRVNEDAWIAMQAGPLGDQIVFAAIDGATTRLTPPPLQHYLDALPVDLTPAAFSARLIRDSLARQVTAGEYADPRALLIEANAELGRVLTGIFGGLDLDHMGFPEEVYIALADDPRLVRLGLPASVITLAEYDPAGHTLRYAHAGDTMLLVVYQDGQITIPAGSDGIQTDSALQQTALRLRANHPDKPFRELVQHPDVRRLNTHSGLYHNYVDEHGLPQPNQGVGVLDGLPELRYFVKTGQVALEGVQLVCALTDGLEWPATAGEAFSRDPDEAARLMHERRHRMARLLDEHGLAGYARQLWRAKSEDADHELYPRMKTHDDATGVLLRFG